MITIAYGDHQSYATKLCHEIQKREPCAVRTNPETRDRFVVRWGCVGGVPSGTATVINPSVAIQRSSNKGECREIFCNKGIPCPKPVYRERQERVKYPIIGRPSYHQAGGGFFVCRNRDEWTQAREQGASYFSEVFEHTHEFRVHCGHGRVIAIHDKDIQPGNLSGHFRDRYDWYLIYRRDAIKDVMLAALRATQAIRLDFAAVDVLWNENTKQCAVLETNTAPSLDGDMIRKKYADYIVGLYAEWKEIDDVPPHKKFSASMDKSELWI